MALKLIRGIINLPKDFQGCVATIGNFDGIHLGHRHLIERVTKKAAEKNLPSLLITFQPQPNEFFSKVPVPARLMLLREKLSILKTFNLDYVLCLRFSESLAKLTAENFIQQILVEHLKIAHIVVGDDFHFGVHRRGDIKLLQREGEKYGFGAENIDSCMMDGKRVSSSFVRHALESGDLKMAERLLGRPFGMSGYVVHGHKRGRMIGFPTANIYLHRQTVPVLGVYAVRVHGLTDGTVYGVANVGTRPTVGGTRSLLEVHMFEFSREIYGEHIYVEFVHKLRDEKKYDSFDLLKQQILLDAQNAKTYLLGQ
jgi:riboflavin kinase/FMN adenylyltransferase